MPFSFSLTIMRSCHTLSNTLKTAIHLMIYGVFFIEKRTKCYHLYYLLLICHIDIFLDHIFVLIYSNLISASGINLNSVEFVWNSVDLVLMPNKCIIILTKMYTVTCGCKKKMHWKMLVQQVWHFMLRIFQVQQRRMLYLSLPVDSVGHSIRDANIRVSSE